MPSRMSVAGLFEGYGGLTGGVVAELARRGVRLDLRWVCDNDPAAAAVLAHRLPGVPNLGDITAVDWAAVEPVQVLTAGFPCQDLSAAGRRAGMRPDTRSGLWAHAAYAIAQLRPALVVIENVRGLLTARGAEPTEELLAAEAARDKARWVLRLIESKLGRAIREGKADHVHWHRRDRGRFLGRVRAAVAAARRAEARIVRAIGTVLGDLAELRFDAEWVGVRASDVGAPHQRFRVFILAWPRPDPDTAGIGCGPAWGDDGLRAAGLVAGPAGDPPCCGRDDPPAAQRGGQPAWTAGGPGGDVAADPAGDGRDEGWAGADRDAGRTEPAGCGGAAPDADGDGLARGPERDGWPHQPRQSAPCGGDPAGRVLDPSRPTDSSRPIGDPGRVDTAQGGSGQELRELRFPDDTKALRQAARGSFGVPSSPELLQGVREQSEGSQQGRPALEGTEAPAGRVRGVPDDRRPARPSQGPGSDEQRSVEPTDAVRVVPPVAALAGGQVAVDGGPAEEAASSLRHVSRAVSSETRTDADLLTSVQGRTPEQAGGRAPTSRLGPCGCARWGDYALTVHTWEVVLNRMAPPPTARGVRGGCVLSARAVEWMMGLPAGWVCDVPGLSRPAMLKLLGNGVCPAQAAEATRWLFDAAPAAWTALTTERGCAA